MLTLFSTPKPFLGHIEVIQRNALESWKRLAPGVEVILFGDDEGTAEVCRELRLRHEPEVLRSKNGTKRLDSIFGRAQEIAANETLAYANCDIVLTKDFLEAWQRLRSWREKYLMVGRRWDMDITERLDFSAADWQERIATRARHDGIQRFYHNIDYFVFPRGLYARIPPLVIGRIWWDHWLVGKAHELGASVVDASQVVCAVHQNHDYGYHPKGMDGVWNDQEAQRNYELASADAKLATIEDAPYRMTRESIEENRWYWMAPAKRRWREVHRKVSGAARTYVWHPLLNATRTLRHSVGIKQENLPASLRSKERRHGMDQ